MEDAVKLQEHEALVSGLLNPSAYAHPVQRVERIDTHISTVLLAGDFAYKIKKPVDLGFLDFSSLEKRRRFCLEELRLNRRTAPAAVSRRRSDRRDDRTDRASASSAVDPVEYAVRMRRFDPGCTLDHLAARGQLDQRPHRSTGRRRRAPARRSGRRAAGLRHIRGCAADRRRRHRSDSRLRPVGVRPCATRRAGRVVDGRVAGPSHADGRTRSRGIRPGVPRRPAPRQHRAARRRAGPLRRHRVQRRTAVHRRDLRRRVHLHGPDGPRSAAPRLAVRRPLPRADRRLRRPVRAPLLRGVPRARSRRSRADPASTAAAEAPGAVARTHFLRALPCAGRAPEPLRERGRWW